MTERNLRKKAWDFVKAPMTALIIWYVLLAFLGIINFSGYIIPLLMQIGFICIIVSLHKISKEIDEVGYSIKNTPIKLSDAALTAVIVLILITGLVCGYAFGGSYPMQWQPKEENEHSEVQEIKEHLLSLGFPENILNDMTAEDILTCQGATKVVVEEDKLSFNEGRKVTSTKQITPHLSNVLISTVYDTEEMTVTSIGVCLSSEIACDGNWQIIHHFCWDINPGFYGTECIQLFPAYSKTNNYWISSGKTSGRVLYTKNGMDYVSPYHSIGSETYTSDNLVLGTHTSTDIFATFSLPDKAENQRGYIIYSIKDNRDKKNYLIDSWFTYNHQQNLFQYPAVTAKENRQQDMSSDLTAFMHKQIALQIWDSELRQ